MTQQIQEFDYSVNLTGNILWEYNNSTNLLSLINAKQIWYDENFTQFWTDWYTDVFNLQTANDFGLAVWSIILGLPLFINLFPENNKPIWGLADDNTGANGNKNFDNGNFAYEQNGIVLTTEQKRIVLKLRYFQLSTRADVLSVNAFLKFVFGDDVIYVLDGLDMSMVYVWLFEMDPVLLQALTLYDLLPRPAAVGIRYIPGLKPVFGLADDDTGANGNKNFDNGTFLY